MSSVKTFFFHYSHFLTGQALSLLVGLASFPILTRILSREEYGMLGLVTTTMFVVVAIAKAGLSDGIVRFYKEYDSTPEERDIFSSTVVIRGLVFSLSTVFLYIVIFLTVRKFLNVDIKYVVCFMIMSGYFLLRPLNVIILNILRVTGRTIFFNFINLLGKITAVVCSLLLLLYIIGAFYGYFIGLVLSELFVSIILFYWFFTHYKIVLSKVSGSLAMSLVKFGLPLLITELSYLLLSYADRYLIAAYQGVDDLGIYSVGYNVASYISDMMMFSLSYAVVPIYVALYQKEGRERTEEFLSKCMHYLLVAIIPICIGYTLVSRDLLVTLASKRYLEAAQFSPIILFGSFFLGMNNILNAGLYLGKKTRVILAIMLTAVIVNIILNLFLLPVYGIMGSAVATLAACMLSSALTYMFSHNHLTIRVNLKPIAYHLALSAVMFLVVRQIVIDEVWINLFVKVAAGLLIISFGVFFIEKDIRLKVLSMLPLK
ncbi:MAG: oligosaccharide flippase family protein [Nitrospirae bacterium]|nr:oligosaccharide flippase family protein [Nitrospirota bacterium]